MKKLLLAFLALPVMMASAQKQYLHCGSVFDPVTERWSKEKTLVVDDRFIVEVLDGYTAAADGEVIDLKNQFVMPGFIDMHVHIESESNPRAYLDKFTLNPADIAFRAVVNAKKTLMAGFTTVRDLGGSGVNISLKNAIESGLVEGPRIFTTGKTIGSTGSHADPTSGVRKDLMGDPGAVDGIVNSVEDARKAVRQRYKDGANTIKITATGGVLSTTKNGKNAHFTIEEIKEIVRTAEDYDFLTAAHAHGDEGMRRAVIAGIHTIEHGTLMSEETMELMKQYGTYLVPTITAGKQVSINAEIEGYYPPMVAAKAKEIGGKQSQATFAKAYKKGVNIAFGTDAGVFNHGENAREFFYMNEAGMPVSKALKAATLVNAQLLGMSDQIGQVKKGYLADLVATDEHPDKNVLALQQVSFVMKEGKRVK
ncbi:MAG: amidohydrolase family protein [Bacteroidetes bacterium]|nr:amidohydrolase family protein [Bacteroidota bacterium]